jgi:hypothetical protein
VSPTYATPFTIMKVAKEYWWKIIPTPDQIQPWKLFKTRWVAGMGTGYNEKLTIAIKERRDGGLLWVSLTRARPGLELNQVYLGPRFANKKHAVLSWLTEPIDWTQWGIAP